TVTDYASPGIFISQKNVSEDKADIEVKAKLNTLEKHLQDVTLLTTIYDDSGKEIASQEDQVSISPQGTTYLNQNIKVDKPRLWDGVNDPYLYRLSSRIIKNGKEIDRIDQNLGIRTVEIIPGEGVLLNGKKYPMHGVARHQDRWGHGSALTYEQHKEDFELMKELGVTTVRLAHYQQAPQV